MSCVIQPVITGPPPERRTEGKAGGLYGYRFMPADWKPAGKSRVF
jgi:hypothetical protein